jgi:autoinducer 2-degrading protein
MFVLTVSINVKPEHVDEFVPAMLANARGSRTEPGNLRFDVLRDEDDPNHFMLYEVYQSAAALEAHRETPHFKQWAAAVEPMLAEPRTRVRSQLLFYGDEAI